MKNAELVFEDYSFLSSDDEKQQVSLPEKLKNIQVSYDGGRLYLYINDVEVYTNLGAGNDFSVTIQTKE